jgi:acyl-coenzyme A synthetase/AMP-(fatty) acid ligase
MAAYVLAHADAQPDKIALEVLGGNDRFTYSALQSAVLASATGLLVQGLSAGDRVLLRLGNTPHFPILFLGAIATGLIPVPTSAQLTKPEITKIAAELNPALVIAADGIACPDGIPSLDTTAVEQFYALPPATYRKGDPNRPAYIIYTSGTSGQPRAVVHAHRAIWARRMMHDGWYGLRADDRMMHAGAFNWTYTLGTGLMDPWSIGATALIPTEITSPQDLGHMIRAHKASIFAAAPGVYRQMLRHHPDLKTPTLRHGLSAGEKLPTATRSAWIAATNTQIHEAFGMSECSTFLSSSPTRPAPNGSLGYPQSGRRVAILCDGQPAPANTEGTIAIHKDDAGLMLGYLDQPTETAAKYTGEWFLTGDTGTIDANGAVTYLGRADDMLNAGGFRVSPLEIEAALTEHPKISEAATVEVPVKSGAMIIAAFYSATEVIDKSELADFAAARLAKYKSPRIYVKVDILPRGANGKLLRKQLRDTFEAPE